MSAASWFRDSRPSSTGVRREPVSTGPRGGLVRCGGRGDPSGMSSPAPLLLTDDPVLADDLHRLAAAAGTAVAVVPPSPGALPDWIRAPLVLVGADALPDLVGCAPTRRDRVHVVTRARVADAAFRDALSVGAESVLELPAAESWLVHALADSTDGPVLPAPVVAVVGGVGGVGASTFAAALASCGARGAGGHDLPVVLVDLDRLGGGLERIVGLAPGEGAHWARLSESAGRLGSRSLVSALPGRERLAVLGWGGGARPRLGPSVAREALSAARRAGGLVVVDLPRFPDEATGEVVARCDDLVVLTEGHVPAVAACAQVLAGLGPVARLHLVVRRRGAGGAPPEEVARALGVPLRAVLGHQRGLTESVGLGLGPVPSRRGPLVRAARAVLGALPR